jgi:hypothetical protein
MVKLLAINAGVGNSTMFPVLLIANHVQTIVILVEKEETVVALIVHSDGLPMWVVLNAKLVVLERLAMGVKIVHWDMHENGMILILHNANCVR